MSSPRNPDLSHLNIVRREVKTLQVNLGYKCNQACSHCHVGAGPNRSEEMLRDTVTVVLDFMRREFVKDLDITGGAPELNVNFKYLVEESTALGIQVTDRCNLTILTEKGFEDLPQFLAEKKVKIVASMPCHSVTNVDRQRGRGVFEKSIRAITVLNELGYGDSGTGLILDLVFNPSGPVLPPDPVTLEAEYKESFDQLGIKFNNLLTMANMPINRFKRDLVRTGNFQRYQRLLVENFERSNLRHVMCRSTLSVDWRGYIYDCDFNQMLGVAAGKEGQRHLSAIKSGYLVGEEVALGEHCFGCFAGRGSGCGGALNNMTG